MHCYLEYCFESTYLYLLTQCLFTQKGKYLSKFCGPNDGLKCGHCTKSLFEIPPVGGTLGKICEGEINKYLTVIKEVN